MHSRFDARAKVMRSREAQGGHRTREEWLAGEVTRGRCTHGLVQQCRDRVKPLAPEVEGLCNCPLGKQGKRCRQKAGKCVYHRGWNDA